MLRFLIGLAIILATTALPPNPAAAQSTGPRVYILDASNSMSNTMDGARDPRQRIAVAKDLLLDLLASAADQPAAVFTFGSTVSWNDELKPMFGRPDLVLPNHPACADIKPVASFAPITAAYRAAVERRLHNIRPNGMTPITNALKVALSALQPYGGGEIVLISDYEAPNCQPRTRSICADILEFASQIQINLRAVQVRLYNVPASNLGRDLRACFAIAPQPPPPAAAPSERPSETPTLPLRPAPSRPPPQSDPPATQPPAAQAPAAVTIEAVPAYAEATLGRRPPDPASLTQSVTDLATGRQVSQGAVGPVTVPAGSYRIRLSNRFGEWDHSVLVPTSRTVRVPVTPGTVLVRTFDAATGIPLPTPVRLEVYQIDAAQIRTSLPPVTLPAAGDRLALGEGQFVLVVDPSLATRQEVPVQIALGETRTIDLLIPSAPTEREVRFVVEVTQPSLADHQFGPPVVILQAGTRVIRTLPDGATAVSLPPGAYQIVVDSQTPHRLPFAVGPGSGPVQVAIQVNPGWFVATGASRAVYLLRDQAGNPLAQFEADRISHSLPEGRYELERLADDQTPFKLVFEIRLGQQTDIRLP